MHTSRFPTAFPLFTGHLLVIMGTLGAACATVLAVSSPAVQFPWNMAGGRGTPSDPYRIETCQQLQNMLHAPAMAYVLTQDIDCRASALWNHGTGFFPVGYYQYGFSGDFNGGGHRITGLRIRRPAADYAGLFGKLDMGARVRNVRLEADIEGGNSAGLLAGWMVGGTVEDVSVSGRLRGQQGVGGLVGVNQGAIHGVQADVDVAGREWVGGITGWNYTAAEVAQASATGAVRGDRDVGGIAGVSHGATIRACASAANVEGQSAGGIVGRLIGNGAIVSTVDGCRFTGTVNGQRQSGLIGIRGQQAAR